ncbi:NAD-dependent protein deacetylase [Plantactinospora veratri]|uniref:NAD-dependent protein deacetylase n=1 Tax=Plantactinospora veratri TaxID=1436122 RepID=A0ABU7SI47_9ACTN
MQNRSAERYAPLAGLLAGGDVVVLSGAGLSTDSGIPDYRGPSGALRRHTPMTYQTFVGDPLARRRYWARSHLGWRTIARAAPNAGHRAVAELDRRGLLAGILTQNVDGLHQAGGARSVIELHGSLARVTCLGCGENTDRETLDQRLRAANPRFAARADTVNPDGDVELPDELVQGFRTVDCQACPGGMLKPDVVFFGESVPPDRVRTCFELVERARLLLVLGSSLTVMSGRRFVIRAAKRDIPVVIVNQGPTRGDDYAELTIDAPLGEVLPELVRLAGPARATAPAGAARLRTGQARPATPAIPAGAEPGRAGLAPLSGAGTVSR